MTVQVPPAAASSPVPQVESPIWKLLEPEPVMLKLKNEPEKEVLRLLVMVTNSGALSVPSAWLPNGKLVGETVTGWRTVTVSVLEVLLLVLDSVQLHATAAEFDRLDPELAATFTFRVIVAVPLPEMDAALFVQVTSCPPAEHVNPPPEPLTKVSPVGRVSVAVTVPDAVPNPLFVTVRVYCAPA